MNYRSSVFNICTFILLLFSLPCCTEEVYGIEHYVRELQPMVTDFGAFSERYPDAQFLEAEAYAAKIDLKGKSIAFLGGSIASLEESDICKDLLRHMFCFSSVTTYGHGGWGYATRQGSIQDFIPLLQPHDIYVLWCSTNDYGTGVPVGNPTDYTEEDNFDESHTNTQCGGINKCIKAIRDINPNSIIIGYTSLRFFGKDAKRRDGYLDDTTENNGQGITFRDYVKKQQETFECAGISCFDQYNCNLFNIDNYKEFYRNDGWHLNENGYFLLGCEQTRFFIDLFKEP